MAQRHEHDKFNSANRPILAESFPGTVVGFFRIVLQSGLSGQFLKGSTALPGPLWVTADPSRSPVERGGPENIANARATLSFSTSSPDAGTDHLSCRYAGRCQETHVCCTWLYPLFSRRAKTLIHPGIEKMVQCASVD